MLGKKINSKEPLPLYAVKEVLSERSKESTEMTYEQQMAFEYSKKFSLLTKAKLEKLLKTLRGIEGLPEEFIVSVVDVVPKDEGELNLLLSKGPELNAEQKKAVLDALAKALK
jgi:DNA-directed RNA polymerase subunit F